MIKSFTRLTFISNLNQCPKRFSSYLLQYKEHGDPPKVLTKEKIEPQTLQIKDNQLLIKMLAAPINPADINMIQGTYAITPPLPAVGGNEGVGKVVKAGANATLKEGSWVIPKSAGVGTWRTDWVCTDSEVIEIPSGLDIKMAATIAVNPCTAYRMLSDFVELSPGDCVIQNGANSGVGQAVIQLARHHFKVKTINVVRSRPNLSQLVTQLKDLGADYVVTDENLRGPEMKEILNQVPKPRLALNCVGGKSTTDLFRHMAHSGCMVTYGGMSKQPLTVPTGVMIFKNIAVRGFWMTEWSKNHMDHPLRATMLTDLYHLALQGHLQPPITTLVPFDKYMEAVEATMTPYSNSKQILVMDPECLKQN
ncbi:MECR [Cordylochernes scorpioides]|uniref:Enoyl-[acyl-carrier-protein] reductase, mitochondrial n=1 Tax=Cordylochernes scorpioides TaxID=51811 RepID=A0ABY6K701_9ARAC|nr:MECR [Cordylochernes scorpioides]